MTQLEFGFEHEGHAGTVGVTCVPSADPVAIGKDAADRGFPVCAAEVRLPGAEGYYRFCGWVQLVRSSDDAFGGTDFEPDPLGPFADSVSPFCFFGSLPTLFDAPSRQRGTPVDWTAQSFLAVLATEEGTRAVRAVGGFTWGFALEAGGDVNLKRPALHRATAWEARHGVLARAYPSWAFPTGSIF